MSNSSTQLAWALTEAIREYKAAGYDNGGSFVVMVVNIVRDPYDGSLDYEAKVSFYIGDAATPGDVIHERGDGEDDVITALFDEDEETIQNMAHNLLYWKYVDNLEDTEEAVDEVY